MPAIATNSHLSHGTRIDAIKKGSTTTAVNTRARPEVFVDGCWVAALKTLEGCVESPNLILTGLQPGAKVHRSS